MTQTIITICIIIRFPALELFLLPYSLWLLNSQLIHLFGQCPLILDTLPFHILPNTSQYTQTHAKRWESQKTNKSTFLQFTFKDVAVSLLDLPVALPKGGTVSLEQHWEGIAPDRMFSSLSLAGLNCGKEWWPTSWKKFLFAPNFPGWPVLHCMKIA